MIVRDALLVAWVAFVCASTSGCADRLGQSVPSTRESGTGAQLADSQDELEVGLHPDASDGGGHKQPLGEAFAEQGDRTHFVRQIPWIGRGQWIKADTHTHTTFSDGAHSVSEVVEKAIEFGCDVVAITDHGDRELRAATPEYAKAIETARSKYPQIVILAGLEWNVPPWGGDEHATVLVPPGDNEWSTLQVFKAMFDDWGREEHDPALAEVALVWLAKQKNSAGLSPFVLLNHPSRKRQRSTDVVEDIDRWRKLNDLVLGFSGAPGHQNTEPLGAYDETIQVVDRWDPVVARVGDAWDILLQRGFDVWAARAPSDFHSRSADWWPGEFSETWLYVPERSPAGVFRALKAGCFFAVHGHIARQVELSVEADGLPRPAFCGEVIEVPRGAEIAVRLGLEVPVTDWRGMPNRIDEVEIIVVTAAGAKVHARTTPGPSGSTDLIHIKVPAGGLVVRARGRRTIEEEPDLLFYTNPIRVLTTEGK